MQTLYDRDNAPSEDIRVVYAAPERVKPGSRFGPVIRSVYVIECCTGGIGSVIINGKEFPVRKGDCYALLPKDTVVHTSSQEQPREGFWCALDGIGVGDHLKTAGITSDAPFLTPTLFEPMQRWMERLSQEWVCRDAGAQLRQLACAYGILGTMLQTKPATEKSSLVDQAIGFMQTHYPDSLSIGELAEHVGLERTYFSELFKQKTGLAPYQYLTQLRIQRACQLLSLGRSITETAFLVGMDPHNFGRVFKKDIGCTPREYVRTLKTSKDKLVARPAHR